MKHLENKIVKHLKSVEQHLDSFKKEKDPEHLHRLRVEIKKTKAIFSFAEKTSKQKFSIKELKPLFHKAGQIRELQIQIKIINELDHLPEKFTAQLKKKEENLTTAFNKNIPSYVKKAKKIRNDILLAKLPDKKAIRKFFDKEMNKAQKKVHSGDREKMHRFRMKIKKLMYIFKALPKKSTAEVEIDTDYINKLQKMAGDWHDTYSAFTFLSHQPSAKQLSEHISKLKKKEEKQFNTLYNFFKN